MRGMPFLFAGVLLGYSIFCGEHGPAQVTDPTALPDVPAQLRVPAGNKLIFKAEAKGVQIYKSTKGPEDKLTWVLEAPLADLFAVNRAARKTLPLIEVGD
jgi:hypothetical protein